MKNIPTPETDRSWASWPYAGPGMSVHVGRDLERRLTVAREALKEILFIRREPLPLVDLDEARVIANKALNQTAPKP